MTKIVFSLPNGHLREATAVEGYALMEVAKHSHIDGIVAECGGKANCATCHVYIGQEWLDVLPKIEDLEEDLLGCVPERRLGSRLSCQIVVSSALDGMKVEIPS